MKLYHGTSASKLSSILKYGLHADYSVRGRDRYIYFEEGFGGAQTWTTRKKEPIILEFHIPKKLIKTELYEYLTYYVVAEKVESKFLKKIWIWDKQKIKWINIL
jgi:hypothetical protein